VHRPVKMKSENMYPSFKHISLYILLKAVGFSFSSETKSANFRLYVHLFLVTIATRSAYLCIRIYLCGMNGYEYRTIG